jgi:DNA-binding NtrC family response regulator
MTSVLVVDDEPAVRMLTVRWLESKGMRVRGTTSADDAIRMLQSEEAGVVVCDVQMPGHDGVWLAGQIRRRFPDTAIVMATGGYDLDAAVACIRLGVCDYLTKPFGRDRLVEAVSSAMGTHLEAVREREAREAAAEALEPHLDSLDGRLEPDVLDALVSLVGPCAPATDEGR